MACFAILGKITENVNLLGNPSMGKIAKSFSSTQQNFGYTLCTPNARKVTVCW